MTNPGRIGYVVAVADVDASLLIGFLNIVHLSDGLDGYGVAALGTVGSTG